MCIASGLASFIAGGQQFLYGNSAGPFPDLANAFENLVDPPLTPVRFGHNPGDAASVARDDQGVALLHIVQ